MTSTMSEALHSQLQKLLTEYELLRDHNKLGAAIEVRDKITHFVLRHSTALVTALTRMEQPLSAGTLPHDVGETRQ
jgi:hypothetical protein